MGAKIEVVNEIVEGKRTFIERDGNVFELPSRHTIELTQGTSGTTVAMSAFAQGSQFGLASLEELDDRIVVHLGPELGRVGPAGMGDSVPEPTGYPFPSS